MYSPYEKAGMRSVLMIPPRKGCKLFIGRVYPWNYKPSTITVYWATVPMFVDIKWRSGARAGASQEKSADIDSGLLTSISCILSGHWNSGTELELRIYYSSSLSHSPSLFCGLVTMFTCKSADWPTNNSGPYSCGYYQDENQFSSPCTLRLKMWILCVPFPVYPTQMRWQ